MFKCYYFSFQKSSEVVLLFLRRRTFIPKKVMWGRLAPKGQNLEMSPVIFLPQSFDYWNTIGYGLQRTKMNENVAIVFLRDLLRFHSLSLFPPKQHSKSSATCSASRPPKMQFLFLFCSVWHYIHLLLPFTCIWC